MKRLMAGLAATMLALPCLAQETLPTPTPLPKPAQVEAPPCGMVECKKQTYQLHWLERDVPCVEAKPVLKEVKTDCVKQSLEIDYNTHSKVCTEMILKPCEVIKEVTICTQKPRVVTDPCTGCSSVVFDPVTETKQVKEITYQLVPQEKVVMVRTPFLKPVEIPIVRKSLVLEYPVETTTRRERFGVLVPVEITERKPACPCQPGCTQPTPASATPAPATAPEAPSR